MKSLLLSLLLFFGFTPGQQTLVVQSPSFGPLQPTPVVQYMQDVSYTIRAGQSQGSGVVIVRNGNVFCWTAAHVVASIRHVSTVLDSTTGQNRSIVWFEPVALVRENKEGGKTVGVTIYTAEVVKYSDANRGNDLALLKVHQTTMKAVNTVFYLENNIVPIGTELYHVGSFLGQMGANSLSTGLISQYGRMFNGIPFDQTSCSAFPGSSGGGTFLRDGRYVGMLVRAAGQNMNLIVPIRRMREWTEKIGLQWALDPTLSVKPTGLIEELDDSPDVNVTSRDGSSSNGKPLPNTPEQPSEKEPQRLPF